MNIENNNFSSSQYSSTQPNTLSSSSMPTHTHTTQSAQPFSSQHQHGMKEDTNDLSKPSFFKNAIGGASSSAQMNSSSASSLLSNQMGSTMSSSSMGSGVVRDPLSLSDIEQRGGLHTGMSQSTGAHEVLSTLKTKENDVLLGAARKINDLQRQEHANIGSIRSNQEQSIAEIQRKEHENIAAITREKENKIAELKREEAAKIAEIQRREHEQINKLQHEHQSKLSNVNSNDKKIHDIAVDAKSKLDQVRLTENKVAQNLSAADQLRAMAHEREVLAEKQNAESMVATSAVNALHPTTAKTSTSHTGHTAASNSALHSSTASSSTSNKLEQQRPIVQQTTTQTTVQQPGDKYTRGA